MLLKDLTQVAKCQMVMVRKKEKGQSLKEWIKKSQDNDQKYDLII